MFEKDIEFSAHEDYFALREDYPIPAKVNVPDWYKKLDHTILNKTIKGCIPFLDYSGFISELNLLYGTTTLIEFFSLFICLNSHFGNGFSGFIHVFT